MRLVSESERERDRERTSQIREIAQHSFEWAELNARGRRNSGAHAFDSITRVKSPFFMRRLSASWAISDRKWTSARALSQVAANSTWKRDATRRDESWQMSLNLDLVIRDVVLVDAAHRCRFGSRGQFIRRAG